MKVLADEDNAYHRNIYSMRCDVTKVILMTLVVRGLDDKTKRSFRAEAIRRGLKLAEAVKEAFQVWRSYDRDAQTLSERDVNNAAYNALGQELERYAGKTILIAEGKLLGVYENPRSAAKDLASKAPHAHHAIVTKVGEDRRLELEWLGGSLNL
jgi:hypothetical protein